MDRFLSSVIKEAGRLGFAWWERWALILAVAILRVLARHAVASVLTLMRNIKLEAQIAVDEQGPPQGGVSLPTDPQNPGGDPSSGGG